MHHHARSRNSVRVGLLATILILAMLTGLIPGLDLARTAHAASGTISFSTANRTNLGQVVHDGDAGSTDISGIRLDIYYADAASPGTPTGSLVYLDLIAEGATCSYPAFAGIDATTGDLVIVAPPDMLVIKSSDGTDFSFQSIYALDSGANTNLRFEGFRDGSPAGAVDLSINQITYEETFTAAQLAALQCVDEIRITNLTINPDTGLPYEMYGYFNNIVIGDPVATNTAPSITSVATASFSENGTGTVYAATATDAEDDALSWSISGADAALFSMNSSTGALTFLSAPNFEAPADSDGNDVYDLALTVSDGSLTDSKALAVTVTDVNEAPSITSAGAVSLAENSAGTVYAGTATDPEGNALTWTVSGADAARFSMNSSTGALTFASAPNFEAPADSDGNNVYDLTLTVSDGSLTDSNALAVTVTDVNEAPVISAGSAAPFPERGTGAVYTATGSDPEGGSITWSISGPDATLFSMNSSTGALTFISAPDFESPADSDGNNVYDLTVTASDGSLTASKALAVTVTNVNEAPGIVSAGTASFAENGAGTVYVAAATDPEGDALTWSISGTDAARFSLNSSTGALTFVTAPDFETPADNGENNVYDLTMTVSDGSLTDSKTVAVTVTNVNEAPTSISLSGSAVSEGDAVGSVVGSLSATDQDAGDSFSFARVAGAGDADNASFTLVGNALRLAAVPDREVKSGYTIRVRATDGGGLWLESSFTITVTDVNEAPTITSAGTASFAENSAGTVYTAGATDPEGDALTWTISGADAARFSISSSTGALTFAAAPDFETPADSDDNNVYDLTLTVSDGGLTDSKALAVTVTDVNETPIITSVGTVSFPENGTGTVYAAAAIDPEGAGLTWSISGVDAALFSMNGSSGALAFAAAPDFETPVDSDGNNVYDLTVTVSDGILTASKTLAVTATNVNEAPSITSPATASFAENGTGTAYAATASDPEGDTLTWTISGADAARFSLNSSTGALAFAAAPNFESPADSGGNNVYDLTVTVSDGSLTAVRTLAVTVTNVNEAPVISSGSAVSFLEGVTGTVYTVTGSDPDGDTLTWSIGGTDAAVFVIDGNTGALAFRNVPSYGAPVDSDRNNVYDITITATDDGAGSLSMTAPLAVSVAQQPPSGGSGGPVGSASPVPPSTETGVPVIVNGETQNAGTSSTTTSDGQTVTTVTIDDQKLQEVLDRQGVNATVLIPVTSGSNVTACVLTGQMIENLGKQGATLEVRTGSASYTLPAAQIDLDAISGRLGQAVAPADVQVQIRIAEPTAETITVVESAAQAGAFSIVVPAVDFTVTCTRGSETVEVQAFSAYVERTIAIPDGVDPTRITTGVVIEPDGEVRHVPTRVTIIDGKYYAVIQSLTNSTYGVIWHPVEFADVERHWAKDAINDMGSRMVVNGIDGGNYAPDKHITRSEFAAALVRALGLRPGTGESKFHDVLATDWDCGYIDTAFSYGLITGYDNGSFGPNDEVTREQAMTILARAMKITGLTQRLTDQDISLLLADYADADAASDYARPGIAACLKAGLIVGVDGQAIAPTSGITRAEVAVIVQRLLRASGLI